MFYLIYISIYFVSQFPKELFIMLFFSINHFKNIYLNYKKNIKYTKSDSLRATGLLYSGFVIMCTVNHLFLANHSDCSISLTVLIVFIKF